MRKICCTCGKCVRCYRRKYWRTRTLREGGTPPKILAKNRRWRARHKKYLKAYYRLRNSCCTQAQFDAARIQQKNRCGICHKRFVKTLNADHDHRKKQFRGLLCSNCNLGLGHFKHNIRQLAAAIRWLRRK